MTGHGMAAVAALTLLLVGCSSAGGAQDVVGADAPRPPVVGKSSPVPLPSPLDWEDADLSELEPDDPVRDSTGPGLTVREVNGQLCWPDYDVPATTIPETVIPETVIPEMQMGGRTIPARTLPGRVLPGRTLPGFTIPGRCIGGVTVADVKATSIAEDASDYAAIDPSFSPDLSIAYWDSLADSSLVPDFTADGFGEVNKAGFRRNQYVRSYFRSDGTRVDGYWRNSPSDGLPTCRVIAC